jgi:hypothetical protein
MLKRWPCRTHCSSRSATGHRLPRPATWLAALAIAAAALAGTSSSRAERRDTGHAARILNGSATAHLHLIKPEGSRLIEEGPVSGALAGSALAELHTGAVFTANFTIRTHGGSIRGRGQAVPHGSGRYQSFHGSFVTTGGSGLYVHVNGRAGLYGVFDRRSDSVVIQTVGRFTY